MILRISDKEKAQQLLDYIFTEEKERERRPQCTLVIQPNVRTGNSGDILYYNGTFNVLIN
jgi:hypothetical protein